MGSLRTRLGLVDDWRHGRPVSQHAEDTHVAAETQGNAEPRPGKSAPNPPPDRLHATPVMECRSTRAAHAPGATSRPPSYPTPPALERNFELPSPEQGKHSQAAKRPGMRSHHAKTGRADTCTPKPTQAANAHRPSEPGRSPGPLGDRPYKSESRLLDGVPKRARPLHDVDGPSTSHLPVKKRRLQHRLTTSRLSRPYSQPATHILNRYASSAEDKSPVLARVLKAARWWGHPTAPVRKAAILNRVRRGGRQAAGARGPDRMWWRFAAVHVLGHSLQLVAGESTGSMFPGGRGGGEGPVPRAWRPHTTGEPGPGPGSGNGSLDSTKGGPLSVPPGQPAASNPPQALPASLSPPPADPAVEVVPSPPQTLIMTPLGGDGNLDEIAAFPAAEFEGRYADLSEDDMDDVYANFAEFLGGGNGDGARSPVREGGFGGGGDADLFYEEYLDGLDGITWVS